jgi:chemotaxis family two-component system sensor kinase Cph1
MGSAPPPLRNASAERVLVVEDDSLIALVMTDQITELGYRVVGPACTMAEARHLAQTAAIDGALLELNLNGVLSEEIADILSRRKIPFVFITGYNRPPAGAYADVGVLHKPFELIGLARAIEGVLTKRSYHGEGRVEQRSQRQVGVSNLQKL